MYATVRRYDGIANPPEATKRVRDSFVPLVSAIPGLIEYDWVDLGQGAMLSVSVFDTLANAIKSNQTAADWVRTGLGSVLPQNPRVEVGKVVAHKSIDRATRKRHGIIPTSVANTTPTSGGGSVIERSGPFAVPRLQHFQKHITVRRYADVTNAQEAAKRVREGFVPLISALPGFIAYYWVDLGHGGMLSVSMFDSLSNAIESGHAAAGWVRANLAAVLIKSPRIEAGKVLASV